MTGNGRPSLSASGPNSQSLRLSEIDAAELTMIITRALETVAERSMPNRITLRQSEAAAALGMSVDAFARYVSPELPVIRRGSMRLYPVAALRSWSERNAAKPLIEELAS